MDCVNSLELAAVRLTQDPGSTRVADAEQGNDGAVAQLGDEATARKAEEDGNFDQCAKLYSRASAARLTLPDSKLDAACSNAHNSGVVETKEFGQMHGGCDELLPMWRQADLLVSSAHCHRRAMNSSNINGAEVAAESALRLFPRHADALHAKGASLSIPCWIRSIAASLSV